MITLNLRTRSSWGTSNYHCAPYGVKRGFRMCAYEFNEFFGIPANATDLRLEFTKRKVPDAYLMEYKRERSLWGFNTITTLDGFDAGLMGPAQATMKRLLADGYKYVRVTHE